MYAKQCGEKYMKLFCTLSCNCLCYLAFEEKKQNRKVIILKITPNKSENETNPAFAARFFLSNPFFPHQLCHITTKHSHFFLRLQAEGMKSLSTVFRFSWERRRTSISLLCPFIPSTLHPSRLFFQWMFFRQSFLAMLFSGRGSDWSIQAPGDEAAVRQKRDCSWQSAANNAGSWHAVWKTVLTAYATVIFRLMMHFIF